MDILNCLLKTHFSTPILVSVSQQNISELLTRLCLNQTSWMDSLSIKSKTGTEATTSSEFSQVPYSVNPFALVPPELQEYEEYTQGYSESVERKSGNSSKSSSTLTLSENPPSSLNSQKEEGEEGESGLGQV